MHRTPAPIVACCVCVLLICVAPVAAQPPRYTDWARVRNLEAGTPVIVTTNLQARRDCQVAFADDSMLVLIRPAKRMSAAVRDAVRRVAPNWPAILGDRVITVGTVRIWKNGIEDEGTPVAALVVLPRSAILEVRRPAKNATTSTLYAIAGIGAMLAAGNNGYQREMERRAAWPAGSSHPSDPFDVQEPPVSERDIVYRADHGVAMPLDDAAWRDLMRGLPLTLRRR